MGYFSKHLRYNFQRKIVWCYLVCFNIVFVFVLLTRMQYYKQDFHYLDSHDLKYRINTTYYSVNDSTKYILLWTGQRFYPFNYFEEGRTVFMKKKCQWNNCYVTSNRQFLGDYVEFDAVAFNGPQLSLMIHNKDFPSKRYPHQKYVYANIEAADNYPVFTNQFDNFFNWTWTYKLNSDTVWGYFIIKNSTGDIIGPSNNMNWLSIDKMKPIDRRLQNALEQKSRLAVWISSNCVTQSLREEFIKKVQHYLDKYNLIIDTYGDCGKSQCPPSVMKRCLEMVRKKYYFYFAFENAFSDDYITEKVVYALNYDTVPVVYGGANYSKFLPDGSYLDAAKLGPRLLAQTMVDLMQDLSKYFNFFRWKRYYSYHFKHESPETDIYCKFCEILHNNTLMETKTVYKNFSQWWMDKVNRTRNQLYFIDWDY